MTLLGIEGEVFPVCVLCFSVPTQLQKRKNKPASPALTCCKGFLLCVYRGIQVKALIRNYCNRPMQYTVIILKMAVLMSAHDLCLRAKKKIMYTPANPNFTI